MTLRIAHVTATFPPYAGGTGNVCFHNARELARRGHDVHVFTAAIPGAASLETCDGVTVHRLRPLVQVGNAPLIPDLLLALRGFDVIHLHYPFILGAEIARLASWLYRTPLVVSFHNDLIGEGMRARLFSLYQRGSALLTVSGAARLCTVSLDHYRASALRRSLPDGKPDVTELPNGVDTSWFAPRPARDEIRHRYNIPQDARVVLFVAALDRAHHFKGLSKLFEAFATLADDARLLIVGDGDLRPAYEQQARALGIAERTIFAGGIAHQDTPPLFQGADVTVLPSSPPESFGLVLIESLACETPVIASNIPGVRTVVKHGQDGLLVDPDDCAGLANAMQTVLRDDDARQTMGRVGRARIQARYDWSQIGPVLEQVYQDVLADVDEAAVTHPAHRIIG